MQITFDQFYCVRSSLEKNDIFRHEKVMPKRGKHLDDKSPIKSSIEEHMFKRETIEKSINQSKNSTKNLTIVLKNMQINANSKKAAQICGVQNCDMTDNIWIKVQPENRTFVYQSRTIIHVENFQPMTVKRKCRYQLYYHSFFTFLSNNLSQSVSKIALFIIVSEPLELKPLIIKASIKNRGTKKVIWQA
uniref:Uncharacterized protein n=1 Tax=Romanomermis culicivorax TaxID=13658 RepID=A0A915IPC7_ROMCU